MNAVSTLVKTISLHLGRLRDMMHGKEQGNRREQTSAAVAAKQCCHLANDGKPPSQCYEILHMLWKGLWFLLIDTYYVEK